MRRLLVFLALSLSPALVGCDLFMTSVQPSSTQSANNQGAMRAQLEKVRAEAKSGDSQAQMIYAATLLGILGSADAKAAYGALNWDELVAEAEAMLETLASSSEEQTALQSVSLHAELRLVTGRGPEALETWRLAHERSPHILSAIGMLSISERSGVALEDPVEFCAENRELAVDDMQLYQFMHACYALNQAGSMPESLPWATPADLELYAQVEQQIEAEAARRNAEYEAQREAERAENQRRMDEAAAASAASASASSSSSSSSSSSQTPSSVSVTLKNNCRQTVKLFFGDKPKYGSGTYSSLSSNTSTSKSFRPGDMIWIVDESQNGISSTSVSGGTRRVEISESCTGLVAR